MFEGTRSFSRANTYPTILSASRDARSISVRIIGVMRIIGVLTCAMGTSQDPGFASPMIQKLIGSLFP